MADLTGTKPKATYKDLLQVPNSNTGFDTTLRQIQTGTGETTPLSLATDKVALQGLIYPNTDGSNGQVLTTDGSGNLSFTSSTGAPDQDLWFDIVANQGTITPTSPTQDLVITGGTSIFTNASGTNLSIVFTGTEELVDGNKRIIQGSNVASVGTSENYLTVTNSVSGDPVLMGTKGTDANIDLKITPDGTGNVIISDITYPNTDGSNGQVLTTDGAGALSFSNTAWLNDTVSTTDATTTTITTVTIPTDSQRIITARVYGNEASTQDTKWEVATAGFKNVSGTVTQVGGTSSQSGTDTGASSWAIEFNPLSGTVEIQVTGENSHTIDWNANIEVN